MASIESCVTSCGYKTIVTISLGVSALAAIITVTALLVIFGNHINATIHSKLMTNVSLLKPNVIDFFWATAKWSGIISLSSFAIFTILAIIWNKNSP